MPEIDTFTAEDRKVLTTLTVDISYIKAAIGELKNNGLEVRVRQLENFRWYMLGCAASSGIIGPVVLRALKVL